MRHVFKVVNGTHYLNFRIVMADDFDVEAMLEAPYRKVGAEVKEIKLMFYT